MKLISTIKNALFCALFLLLPLLSPTPAYAQSVRVYTQTVSSQANTDTPAQAVDGNLNTRARIRASSGLALGAGAYTGHIELQYSSTLPANTTSYIKIRTDDNLLPSLLGGSLGGLLSDVLGAVLIGNQEFTVQARNNTTVILQGNSQNVGDFGTNRLRIVTDAAGEYYIAITPSLPYNRLRLTNRVGSLIGLFNVRNLDVYDAFYISSADNCGRPSYTSFDGSGLTLDLLTLSDAGVDNPGNAIDGNLNTYSQLSLGIVGVAASIEQTVYFDGLSNANDQFNVRLRLDPSLVELGVANSIQIIAQNGPNTVQTLTLSGLLNAELLNLLQGNQIVTIPVQTNVPANRITVRYNALLNVGLNQTLDLYEISRVPRVPVISDTFTLNPRICAGSTASLVATTSPGYQLQWFSAAQGGTPLSTLASGQPFVTPALSTSTTYYVGAIRTGCTDVSARIPVRVNVIPLPTSADISIASPLSACQGNITLAPTTNIPNAVVRYYTSQAMTQEITTGFSGNPGVTYTKDNATGTLTISGLNQASSPYNYFVALQVDGLCTNAPGTLKQVTVNFSQQLVINVNSSIQGCGSVNLSDAILNFDPANTYTFFNSSSAPITAEAAANITASGQYFIQAQGPGGTCASVLTAVNVVVNQQPVINVPSQALVTTIGNSVTLNATASPGTLVWYNSNGTALGSNIAGPFTTAGVYSFTGVATNAGCSASTVITVTVLSPSQCPPLTQPRYATTQSSGSVLTGGVANGPNAVDANLQTYSTIVTGIGLLGVGTTWQTLEWEQTIPAGTPVTIKLGSEYSGVTLLGGFSVIGTKRNGSGVPQPIGLLQPVSGSILNLLPGQNTFEYTFVPSNASGPQAYDGVRVVIGSTVSVAQNAKIFDAYYNIPATQVACTYDVRDVLYGSIDLGVGVLTSTVGVANAYQAVDNSNTTAATMFSGVGVLAAAELSVLFNTPSIQGDRVRLRLSKPGTLLSLGLLNGLVIQPMLGNAVSGTAVSSSLLSLELLGGGESAIVTFTPDATFDRLRIRYGGVAGVLEFLNVHDVDRLANTQVTGGGTTNTVTACQGQTISLASPDQSCTTFIWYDAEVGGNAVGTGSTFTVPANLAAGTYTFWIQPIRYGCPFLSRGSVTVNVTATAPQNAIQSVSINGGAATSICAPNGNVTLAATLNPAVTITNPVFQWYSSGGTNPVLIAGQTSATLALTGLAPGTYTYYVGLSAVQFCQTGIANLTSVPFTILPPSVAADIAVADVGICQNGTVVITPTSTLTSPQFTYYFTNGTNQQITDNLVIGTVTYDIAADGSSLTITGLPPSVNPYTYYVAVSSTTTCRNLAGNLADVQVRVGSLPTPTTNNLTQSFCSANNPTIASLQVNQTNVVFYSTLTGGTPLATTTPLVNGSIYYVALTDGVCQSAVRLAITVLIGNPPTPTTTFGTQSFCAAQNPTVANIQVNQTGVVFYSQASGGTILSPTTPLVAGTYYAAIQDGLCQSATRLAITVTINNPPAPTTSSTAQNFCSGSSATVASLDINEANVNVYTTLTGGTPLAEDTPLVSGTYYATLIGVTGCESVARLAIAVTITSVGTPTTNDDTQDFCLSESPTIADISVNQTGVVFYDAALGGNSFDPTAPLASGVYYAALMSGICGSDIRLAITVNVSDPATPTTNNLTQTFCELADATLADIQINETGVVFYDTPIGGTPLASSTLLTAGTIYVVAVVNGCESSVRLPITIVIDDPAAPTTSNTDQVFCASENPTIANILTKETNVNVYIVATGGTPLPAGTALVTGTYYLSLTDAGNSCESSVRLAVNVTVSEVGTPTTTDVTQDFCQTENPTVADIQVNETGVIFYDAATGGNLINADAPLANGVYYAAISIGTCESELRLAITINLIDPGTPTTENTTQVFCIADSPTVADLQVTGTGILIYDAATGGNLIAPTTALVAGTYYAANSLDGCESSVRLEITVIIDDPEVPTTNDATQDFCQADTPTVADIQVNESGVVFYTTATGGTALEPGTALTNGSYFAQFGNVVCESATRLEIVVTVSDPAIPTTNNTTQIFCQPDGLTVSDIEVTAANPVFYDAPTGGNLIDPSAPLTAGVYYVANVENGCESAGRLAVTIEIGDPGIPTTNDATQDFCTTNNPTVADIQVNETEVVFFTTATGGTALDPATPLSNGIYYAAFGNTDCEGLERLAITVSVTDLPSPTTNSATQNFCSTDGLTISDIQVNETNVVFYNAASGGTALDPTTPLVAGTYFVALTDGICESASRLEITVTITTASIPTTNDSTQDFCAANNPTVADIQVNETGVVFFTEATGGTALDPATPLDNGTYYAAFGNASCQGAERLAIVVTVIDLPIPTTNSATQNFCSTDGLTISDIQINETNVVFYSAASGGTALDPTTPLAAGTYFVALTDGICESATRLEITVTTGSAATPTTNDTTQEFCQADVPTVGNIQVNETGVVFYTAATGGTPLDPATPLTSGVYFATLVSGGCESAVRLEIAVTVNDPGAPTTKDATQNFCQSLNPTVADLEINEDNVLIYATATGGTPLNASDILQSGTYYAALVIGNCESEERLAITVTVTGSATAVITGGSEQTCISQSVTYSTTAGMSNYVWAVVGGTITAGGTTSDNTVTVEWTTLGVGVITVAYLDVVCGSTVTASLDVSVTICSDLTITKTVNNASSTLFSEVMINESLPSGYTLVSFNTSAGVYVPGTGIWLIPTLLGNTSATLSITVRVNPVGNYLNAVTIDDSVPDDSNVSNNGAEAEVVPICLTVYNEFTPNGDGSNDVFRIDCIEEYPNSQLQVFNRYGVLVYKMRNYQNNWDGTANQNSPVNEDKRLPVGTYYYILELGDGSGTTKQGWLYIMR